MVNVQKYILTFLITAAVFAIGFFISDYLNEKRFSEIELMRQDMEIDVLALETQFSILETVPCKDLSEHFLAKELHMIGERLQFMENTLGVDNPEVVRLKKYYSLLQIRHWLLSEKISQQCDLDLTSILYFYSNREVCPSCEKKGYVLSFLRKKYPLLRVYSFDYNLDLPALATLKSLYPKKGPLPMLVIDGTDFYGFRNVNEMEEILPETIFNIPISSSLPLDDFQLDQPASSD